MRTTGVLAAMIGLAAFSGCNAPHGGSASSLPDPVMIRRPVVASRGTRSKRLLLPPVRRRPVVVSSDLPRGVDLPGGIRRGWRYIVIHHSASESGNATQFDRYHRDVRGWNELGYHFVIGNGHGSGNGEIEVGPRWWKQKHGAHCKTPDNRFNDYGIGICLVGDFETGSPPSSSQLRSLEKLVAHLMRVCGLSQSSIYTHGGVTHQTSCPGRGFSMEQFKSR
ncbi:MAG: N-acetylmuramoyl-L-alanine amidase, partial [Planctomycetes bacterium]|nr:N-acetylmuramoyl-L-alanine amidase [Planctomycetota bacterium]